MDTRTGEVREIPQGQSPLPTEIQVSEYELRYLENVPNHMKAYELSWLRTYKSKKWSGIERAQRKEAFRQGWNSAVFMAANYFVLDEKEAKKIQEDEAKKKAEEGVNNG